MGPAARRGSVRHQVHIARPVGDIWALVGDAARVHEWFPGITACTVEGDLRTITVGSGLELPEQLVTIDDWQHRFQYRITAPFFREHLSTLDVLDLGDRSSLVVYSVDADPATMALVIGGAAGGALQHLRELLQGGAR